MMNQKQNIRFLVVVSLLVMAIPVGASASISAFKFLGIEGIGDGCDLNSRLGFASGSTEHVVNIQDCVDYGDCELKIAWGLDRTPATGTMYAVKVSAPGGACVDTDFTTLDNDCTLLVSDKNVSSPNYMTFTVKMSDLTGDCQAGTDKATKIYIIVKESGTEVSAETLLFDIDLERPAIPELQEPVEGDSNVTVKWDAIDETDDSTTQYKVYWSKSSFSNAGKGGVDVAGPMSGTSYQVTDLENDTTYYFGVTSFDENDNESLLSEVTAAMPVNVSDFWEQYQSKGGTDDGGFCFLATAAWGSYMAPDVMTLRTFRDTVLMTSGPGRAFVRLYYRLSPPLADFIAARPALRSAARVALMPVVVVARASVATSPFAVAVATGLFLLLLSIFVGVAVRSWRRQ